VEEVEAEDEMKLLEEAKTAGLTVMLADDELLEEVLDDAGVEKTMELLEEAEDDASALDSWLVNVLVDAGNEVVGSTVVLANVVVGVCTYTVPGWVPLGWTTETVVDPVGTLVVSV